MSSAGKEAEQPESPYIVDQMKNGMATLENSLTVSYKICTYIWPDNYPPNHLPKRNGNLYLHKTLYISFIHNHQTVETTQMSFRGIDKQNVLYPCNGILLSNKKEWIILHACSNVDASISNVLCYKSYRLCNSIFMTFWGTKAKL